MGQQGQRLVWSLRRLGCYVGDGCFRCVHCPSLPVALARWLRLRQHACACLLRLSPRACPDLPAGSEELANSLAESQLEAAKRFPRSGGRNLALFINSGVQGVWVAGAERLWGGGP